MSKQLTGKPYRKIWSYGSSDLNIVFYLLLGLAFALRLVDGWKVPVFMDEMPIIYNVARFFGQRTLIPTHFNYPTFFSYLSAPFVFGLFILDYLISGHALSGLTDTAWIKFLFEQRIPVLVWGGRAVSLLLFTATLWMITRWAVSRYGWFTGFIAGCVLTFDPAGAIYFAHARYALPDITASFFVTAGMILLFEVSRGHSKKYLYAAAFVSGLAVNTKYNTGMILVPLSVLILLQKDFRRWKVCTTAAAVFLAGFITASPAWLFVPDKYIYWFLWESRHMAEGHMGSWGKDWIWILQYLWNTKTLILLPIIAAVLYSLKRRHWEDWLFLLLLIPSFLYIGQFEKKSIHYFIFVYPVTALFVGRWAEAVLRAISSRILRTGWILLAVSLLAIYPSYRLSRMIRRDLTTDNRISAEHWIEANVPSDAGIVGDALLFVNLKKRNVVDKAFDQAVLAGQISKKRVESYFHSVPIYYFRDIRELYNDPSVLDTLSADYLLIASSNYTLYFKQDSNSLPDSQSPLHDAFYQRKAFYERLLTETLPQYKKIKTFDSVAGPVVSVYKLQSDFGKGDS